MEAIAVDLVCTETIKPQQSLDAPLPTQPFKLCLLDQITPRTYVPFIFFFQNDQNALTQVLKTSLSEALTKFYPFSGRMSEEADNNLFIDRFDAGVPFKEARAACHVAEFLTGSSRTISLDRFLPLRPFCDEKSTPDAPMLAVQLTRFSCGGLALGACVSHKLADVATCAAFFNTWAAIARGDSTAVDRYIDLHEGASRFPAVDPSPERYASLNEKLWFSSGGPNKMKRERFVFDEEALTKLKSSARSNLVPSPTRVQALSAFIWKSTMSAATKTASPLPRTHVMTHIVNIRPRGHAGPTAMGNLFLNTSAFYDNIKDVNVVDPNNVGDLAGLVSESISRVSSERVRSVRGKEGSDMVLSGLEEALTLLSLSEGGVLDVISMTSWVNMGVKEVDFGWGKPVWVGVYGGEGGLEVTNLVVLNDVAWAGGGGGIEVWFNIDEKVLQALKNDPEFLAFGVLDPPIPLPQNHM